MAQMIKLGKELIRINPEKKTRIDYSTTDGKTWHLRFDNNLAGEFLDLIDNGEEILAQTSKGLYYSKTEGKTWHRR